MIYFCENEREKETVILSGRKGMYLNLLVKKTLARSVESLLAK